MIEITIQDGLAEVVLNAPDRLNSLDTQAMSDLRDAYDQAEDAGVRALLLRGEGRAFCAGRDISDVDPTTDNASAYLRDIVTPVLQRMSAFPAPTFAAAQGACLGLGLGLLVATDVVYLAEDAKIGSPFANLGAVLDSGGHWLFVERLGPHRALDLIYTSDLISGEEAVRAGLFSRSLPVADLLETTRAAALKASQGPTQAFDASKRLVAEIRDHRLGLWESIAGENIAQGALRSTTDYQEGFAAFQGKRRPKFTGGR